MITRRDALAATAAGAVAAAAMTSAANAAPEKSPTFGNPDQPAEGVFHSLPLGRPAVEALEPPSGGAVLEIGFGTDLLGAMQVHQSREFAIRAEVLSPLEVIRAATTTNAELLQMSGKLGVVAPGRYADLLVVDTGALLHLVFSWAMSGPADRWALLCALFVIVALPAVDVFPKESWLPSAPATAPASLVMLAEPAVELFKKVMKPPLPLVTVPPWLIIVAPAAVALFRN